jgi:hypothetical protein
MKKTLTAVAVGLSFTAGVYAQGTVDFRNRNTGATPPLDAPVSDVGGAKLGNANFVANIFYSATQSGSFTAIADAAAPFRTGTGAGYWNFGTDSSRAIPGIAGGSSAWIQIRVWDSTKGADYATSKAAGSNWGESAAFQVTLGGAGSPPSVPAVLAGLQPFTLNAAIPEPSTIALGMLGAAALLLRRRSK